MNNKNLYFAWIKFQRRAVSMESFFDYQSIHITSVFRHKYLRPLDYLVKGIKTFAYLLKNKPEVVWLQLPPTFLLNILLFYQKVLNTDVIIISDCHNGVFFGKWKKYFNPKLFNRSNFVIVHNHVIKKIAIQMGLDINRTLILEDRPAERKIDSIINSAKKHELQVLMPCGFSKDEPLNLVFEAAKQIPNITILISGPKEKGTSLFDYSLKPDNVILVGYLSLPEYEALFMQSDLIMGLTTEDHIQLSVANEATGLEKPMILSDTILLREMFDKGAIYVNTLSSESIAKGIKKGFVEIKRLREAIKVLKKDRNTKWNNMASSLKELLTSKV